MRIGGEKILRLAVDVGEVAAAAARDENFLSQPVGVFEQCNAAAALARFDSAHEAGGASAEDQCVETKSGVDPQSFASVATAGMAFVFLRRLKPCTS
jgi:hypothetical protein